MDILIFLLVWVGYMMRLRPFTEIHEKGLFVRVQLKVYGVLEGAFVTW
jgi:hypothetical protein